MEHPKIAVYGDNPVAREVLRLAVAMGLTPAGIPHPDSSEPWVHGLSIAPETTHPHYDARILWSPNKDLTADRTVVIDTGSAHQWNTPPDVIAQIEHVQDFGELVGKGHPFIPTSQLAMALLRICLETEISGILSQDDLIILGDAMMIQ